LSETRARRPVGRTLLAVWRWFCYKLTYHHCFAISLKRWIWLWVILPHLVAWIGRLAWVWAILLSALGVAVLVGAEIARRRQYVLFCPAPLDAETSNPSAWAAHGDAPDAGAPLAVDQPLLCWASGLLGVEGKERALAGERASLSFVRTREHIVMAQVQRTRFLLLARVPKADVGYWYAFFYPRQVQSVRLGTLYCGFSKRPGLALWVAGEKGGQSARFVLGFEDAVARQRVLDDLRRDVKSEAFV
jgi:hypothetical protein